MLKVLVIASALTFSDPGWTLRDVWSVDAHALRELAGTTADVIFEHRPRTNTPTFSVALLDDRDGDGVPEMLVGDAGDSRDEMDRPLATGKRGAAYVLSGNDGALLRTLVGRRTNGHFGFEVTQIADVDGDGTRDVAIGAPGTARHAGSVHVYTSDGARELWSAQSEAANGFGHCIVSLGHDIAVGSPFDSTATDEDLPVDVGWHSLPLKNVDPFEYRGAIRVLAGERGKVLRTFLGPQRHASLGFSLAVVDDQTGDGIDEVFTKCGRDDMPWMGGGASLLDGSSGALLQHLEPPRMYEHFGIAIATVRDESNLRVVVGSHGFVGSGAIDIFDREGELRHTSYGELDTDRFGFTLATVSDIDGDGCDDVAAHGPGSNDLGVIRLHSGLTGAILAERRGVKAGNNDRLGNDLDAMRVGERTFLALGGGSTVRLTEIVPVDR